MRLGEDLPLAYLLLLQKRLLVHRECLLKFGNRTKQRMGEQIGSREISLGFIGDWDRRRLQEMSCCRTRDETRD